MLNETSPHKSITICLALPNTNNKNRKTIHMSSTPSIRLKPLHISILIFGCLIALLSFGPRSTMGFFMTPVTEAHGWGEKFLHWPLPCKICSGE